MFGRRKKGAEVSGHPCPYCEYVNDEGAETCVQCYYSLNKSAREQPMASPSSSGEEIMDLLLGENEAIEENMEVVEAVLSLDEVMVDVDQYELSQLETDAEGEVMPESFQFIGGAGPTLSETVASKEEEEVELHPSDAPENAVMFEIEKVDPFDEVAEPVHTGKGGLYSSAIPSANDDDLLGTVGPLANDVTPELPNLPEDEEHSLAQASAIERPVIDTLPELPDDDIPLPPATPVEPEVTATPPLPDIEEAALPELPEDDAQQSAAPPLDSGSDVEQKAEVPAPPIENNRIWPWPEGKPWDDHRVYQEVVEAMEHIKHGRMNEAAITLDTLGPHLHENLNMLLHISVLMQHLGRQDHVKWTLDMAAYVHPNHPQVHQARAQILG
tara:strand:- start:217 stop:1371 length:1155 start_codon:yes stop_codon:yes gene_type:complete